MKKDDIEVGTEYAVVVGHFRQGTRAGDAALRRGTVTGWTTPRFREPAEVIVKLAEPYNDPWAGVAYKGKTEFTLPTRKVVCTWEEQVPAAAAREEMERQREEARNAKDARVTAAREELRSLIPADLQPRWLTDRSYAYDGGGGITPEELLAICRSVLDRQRASSS